MSIRRLLPIVLLLSLGANPIWNRGTPPWHAYLRADALDWVSNWAELATGPQGRIQIRITGGDGTIRYRSLPSWSIAAAYPLDIDHDGDIDLADWAAFEADRSARMIGE